MMQTVVRYSFECFRFGHQYPPNIGARAIAALMIVDVIMGRMQMLIVVKIAMIKIVANGFDERALLAR